MYIETDEGLVVGDIVIAEGWKILDLDNGEKILVSRLVFNHPKLGDNYNLVTTTIQEEGEDEVGKWVKTKNTTYYLGVPHELTD